jgi:hypothetical protein
MDMKKAFLVKTFLCSDTKIAGIRPRSKNIILYLLRKPSANTIANTKSHLDLPV